SKPQSEMADPFRKALDHSMIANLSETLAKKEADNDPYSQLSFAETDIPLEEVTVQKKLDKYLSRFAYLKKPSHHIHKKADQLLPRIAKILKSYGVPEDFKYIAVVESSLNPKTTSHKGAGGYWQFMPATARLYGLKVNGDRKSTRLNSSHVKISYAVFCL